MTEEEILDLAQRLKIAKLILEGKTYDEIAEKVGTSTSTSSTFMERLMLALLLNRY